MKHLFALGSFCLLSIGLSAQPCSPTFGNPCYSWHNQTITVGDIDWSIGSTDCSVSDYTSLSTTVDAGVAVPMTVLSGVWCGCAVWVDLNNDQVFDDTENLYYQYVGGDPGYTYSFTITIPVGSNSGPHRMRVIAPWGSDGFLNTNTNGFGPCGAYQYGNFDDFTLSVSGNVSVPAVDPAPALITGPNPTTGVVTVSANHRFESITVHAADGRPVKGLKSTNGASSVQLDLGDLAAGIYLITTFHGDGYQSARVVKQ